MAKKYKCLLNKKLISRECEPFEKVTYRNRLSGLPRPRNSYKNHINMLYCSYVLSLIFRLQIQNVKKLLIVFLKEVVVCDLNNTCFLALNKIKSETNDWKKLGKKTGF